MSWNGGFMRTVLISVFLLAACHTDKVFLDSGTTALVGKEADSDADRDGFPTDEDCDDEDADVHPDAEEICDGVDNDCDGDVDEGVTMVVYQDQDGDGYGDGTTGTQACEPESGMVEDGTDCDDEDPDIHPDADELCDNLDNNCNGEIDEGTEGLTWYFDADGDGHGDSAQVITTCEGEAPEGYVAEGEDCDDENAEVYPGAPERCDDLDNDCNGLVDDGVSTIWYADLDGDGAGDATRTLASCDPPGGYVTNDEDCDDTEASVNPWAFEACNGMDDDCDGTVDEADALDASTWYADGDGDGFGDLGSTETACEAPSGYVADPGDCDDDNAAVNPDATEICNGIDDDCDTYIDADDSDVAGAFTYYIDHDGDGYGSGTYLEISCEEIDGWTLDSSDCDDLDADVFPGADEVCNGVDDDCDGTVDEGEAIDMSTWYADADGDGYGDAGSTAIACDAPTGYVEDATDCDDEDDAVNPDAVEVCNGVDDDCDGETDTDDDDLTDGTAYYLDHDGDGYGTEVYMELACEEREGWTLDSTDCDDLDADVFPGADEVCNGIDDDCDGAVSWLEEDVDEDGQIACQQALWLETSATLHMDPTYAGAYGSLEAVTMLTDYGVASDSSDLVTLTITSELLDRFGVLVLYGQGYYGPLSAASAAALEEWIYDGGRLLYVGGWSYASSCSMVDSLPSDLGISCSYSGSTWSGTAVLTGSHPVLDDVSTVIGLGGELWEVSSPAEAIATTAWWPSVVVAEYGAGRVVGLSDEWHMYNTGTNGAYDISAGDNRQLVDNIWAWLSDFGF